MNVRKYSGEHHKSFMFYAKALGFFLVLNALRFALSWGTGDITLFQADYAVPPVILWLAYRLGFARWVTIVILFVTTLLILTIDAVSVAGRQFQWGPDAILPYLSASRDLPWRIIAPVAGAILLVTVLGVIGLLWGGRARFALWPLVLFLVISATVDACIGTSRFRDSRSYVNVLATAIVDLGPLYVGSVIRGGALRRISSGTMATALSHRDAPAEILSVGLESFGLARNPEKRAALVEPLIKELRADYDIVQDEHPFFGATLQGEIRELCGVRLVGNATDSRVKRRLKMCLPWILSKRGYDTQALHGNGGNIYFRSAIYPAMGFKRSWFYGDLRKENPEIRPCSGILFDGACDVEVYKKAVSLFDGRKRFVHVMSLDSHLPVPDSMENECDVRFSEDRNLCRYAFLIERSLGSLGMLVRKANNKPDVIYIYGDHAPPFRYQNIRDVFSRQEIPFLVLTRRLSSR